MKTLFLVACAQKKRPGIHKANGLYISDLFVSMRAYVEQEIKRNPGDLWAILSAKYGLVQPTQLIESYDLSLTQMPLARRRWWAAGTSAAIGERIREKKLSRIVWLAGVRYRERMEELIAFSFQTLAFETPMRGMGIGQQLRWMKAQVAL